MFSEPLKKILALTEQTGGSLVVYNESEPEKAQVILSLKKYEELVNGSKLKKELNPDQKNDLTSEELTDRINGDISTWKNQEKAQFLAEESKNHNPWAIPPQVKKGAEEVK
ncbi:MAG: hypothetical protein ACOX6C_00970 [Patescibacteria group bacterium]|jgi:hypothetical protein